MRRRQKSRRGFSIVEVAVASTLMVLLALLISNAWIGLGRPFVETTNRCRIAQESMLAVASLARDFGGFLPDGFGPTGSNRHYRLVGRMQPDGSELWLCFDGGEHPNGQADWTSPDVVVVYQVVDDALVRLVSTSEAEFVVARNVESWALTNLGEDLEILLTFARSGITQTYTFVAKAL